MIAPKVAVGTLRWRVRRSFQEYIRALPDGAMIVSEGAEATDDGAFVLPADPGASVSNDNERVFAYRGSVSFHGHSGILRVVLRDPEVRVAADGSGSVTTRSAGAAPRITVARFASSSADTQGVSIPRPRLTAAGVAWLGDVYAPGDALDPITLVGG
ncbi:HtaA domain-containing protein [Microbacterium trichothecenolyticum]|uniref:Htaa n=1 Tax=Microbacterium trichothecenolyticum TaxID=69370 RepID=A0A0M2HDP1_MICTR|nr:HtaA domain-containing protein [Microbacterium trichothecenolyticum]KJL42346.1 Htaa [Microbacterium trichothecenolyticum]